MTTERQREYRRGKRLDILKVEIELTPATRPALVETRKVGAWDEDDKFAVETLCRRLRTS